MSELFYVSKCVQKWVSYIYFSQKLREDNVCILTISHIFYTDTITFHVNWGQNIMIFLFGLAYELYLWSKDINKIIIFLVLQIWLKKTPQLYLKLGKHYVSMWTVGTG